MDSYISKDVNFTSPFYICAIKMLARDKKNVKSGYPLSGLERPKLIPVSLV